MFAYPVVNKHAHEAKKKMVTHHHTHLKADFVRNPYILIWKRRDKPPLKYGKQPVVHFRWSIRNFRASVHWGRTNPIFLIIGSSSRTWHMAHFWLVKPIFRVKSPPVCPCLWDKMHIISTNFSTKCHNYATNWVNLTYVYEAVCGDCFSILALVFSPSKTKPCCCLFYGLASAIVWYHRAFLFFSVLMAAHG